MHWLPYRVCSPFLAQFHVKSKGEDGCAQADALLSLAREAGAPLGVLPKEASGEGLPALWAARLAACALPTADAAPGLSLLLAPKDEAEVRSLRRAAALSSKVLEAVVVKRLEDAIDQGTSLRHSALATAAADAAMAPSAPPLSMGLKAEHVDTCFPFVVQSGGHYDLRLQAGSSDRALVYEPVGVIVVQLGCRYKHYCSIVGRTYMIDAPVAVTQAYAALVAAHSAAIDALRVGARCCDAHAAARAALCAAPGGAELEVHLPKSVGSALGLEMRDSQLSLSAICQAQLEAGMAFSVFTGLAGMQLADGKPFALLLADTVLVAPAHAPAELLTTAASKPADVQYQLAEPEAASAPPARSGAKAAAGRSAVLEDKTRADAGGGAEARRKAAQDELAAVKNGETLRRLTEAKRRNAQAASSSGAATDFAAYRVPSDVPAERAREPLIVVDRGREALLLPIYGQLVPFHIGAVKNCSASQEGAAHFIRIHFNVPGAAFGGAGYAPAANNPGATFLRELTFRTVDGRHAGSVVSEVKALRAAAKQRVSEAAERATLVRQEKLALAKGRVHRLADVWVRPAFGGRGRKQPGTLECHANGFRYSTPRSEDRLDITFSNIKHAFFQPSEKELITLLHFHLHDPIMVGKKKTHDVQVFAEVMDAVQNLDGARRSVYDPDELEDEQRERERRNRVNSDFLAFTKRCQEVWEKDFAEMELEFDIPFRELGFPGVPFKTSSFVIPTVNCLVDLVETPFLVVTLADIEVVNLERVSFALKNFDMAIVFKDFTRDVHRIDAIDMKSLDTIKEWLNSVGVKYYESKMNLNWKPILKTILVGGRRLLCRTAHQADARALQDDPHKFVEDGGWDFLDLDKSDDEDEESEESDGACGSRL